jgi:hypothetical protein
MVVGLGSCSDDTQAPPPDKGTKDISIADQAPKTEKLVGLDAKTEAKADTSKVDLKVDLKVDSPQKPKYSGLITAGELLGSTKWGPQPTPPPTPVRILSLRIGFDAPSATIKPDFIDAPAPPNCVGYKWAKGSAPNKTAGDAGRSASRGTSPRSTSTPM